MSEKKQFLKSMDAKRKQVILGYLGVSEKEWDKVCAQCPELATLKPEMLMRHFKENAESLGFGHKEWVNLCQKTPQLYEVNLNTLKKHIVENAKLMGITEEEWIKICKSEPGLFLYNQQTLEKTLRSNATALGIPEDKWRRICIKRGALLAYKPETLVNKVKKFIEYVRSPRVLLESQDNASETMVQTLKSFKGIPLEQGKVLDAFLRHPNNLLSAPEKMAYSFAYISMMAKAFNLNEDLYRFLSYIDLSVEPNLKMHYLYACSHYHKNKKVSLFTLVGEKKKDVKKTLLNTISKDGCMDMPQKEKDIVSMYPCPLLRRLKKDKTD